MNATVVNLSKPLMTVPKVARRRNSRCFTIPDETLVYLETIARDEGYAKESASRAIDHVVAFHRDHAGDLAATLTKDERRAFVRACTRAGILPGAWLTKQVREFLAAGAAADG